MLKSGRGPLKFKKNLAVLGRFGNFARFGDPTAFRKIIKNRNKEHEYFEAKGSTVSKKDVKATLLRYLREKFYCF